MLSAHGDPLPSSGASSGLCILTLSLQARGAAAEGWRVCWHVAAAAGWGRWREQGALHREAPRQQEGAVSVASSSAVTLTRAQTPRLTETPLPAAGWGLTCPGSCRGWVGHSTTFVLLSCSFLNQVLPSSVPVCFGQGSRLQDPPSGGPCSGQGQAGLLLVPLGQLTALPWGWAQVGEGRVGCQHPPHPCTKG